MKFFGKIILLLTLSTALSPIAFAHPDEVIVYLHSIGKDASEAKKFHAAFGDTEVIAPTLTGHEETNKLKGLLAVSASEWRADADLALDQAIATGKKITVVGYSLGSLIALDLILRRQSEINKAVLIAVPLELSFGLEAYACLGRVMLQSPFWLEKATYYSKLNLSGGAGLAMAGACAVIELQNEILDPATDDFGGSLNSKYERIDSVGKKIQIPLLIVASEADQAIHHSSNRVLIEASRAQSHIFEESLKIRHETLIYSDKPLVQELVRQFLN